MARRIRTYQTCCVVALLCYDDTALPRLFAHEHDVRDTRRRIVAMNSSSSIGTVYASSHAEDVAEGIAVAEDMGESVWHGR